MNFRFRPYFIFFSFLLLLTLVLSSQKAESPKSPVRNIRKVTDIQNDEAQIAEQTKYFLVLRDGFLMCFEKNGNKEILLKKKESEEVFLTDSEKEELQNGIYAESYEDLYLYFESYLS